MLKYQIIFHSHTLLLSIISDPRPENSINPLIPYIPQMNLFIFHRDLRLFDNTSLILQILRHKRVTPVFIFTPQQIQPQNNAYFSHNSVQFMVETLEELRKEVDSYGGRLYYLYGDSV